MITSIFEIVCSKIVPYNFCRLMIKSGTPNIRCSWSSELKSNQSTILLLHFLGKNLHWDSSKREVILKYRYETARQDRGQKSQLTWKSNDSSRCKLWLYPIVHKAIHSSTDSPFLASSLWSSRNWSNVISSLAMWSFLTKLFQSSSWNKKDK